jgi:polyisoprenoid-binding protein YceI
MIYQANEIDSGSEPMTQTQTDMQELLTNEMQGAWSLDPDATTVRFSQRAMWGLASVRGTFAVTEGSGRIDPSGGLTGDLVLSAASVDTKNAKRDTHLRSADFFDVDLHPTLGVRVLSGAAVPGGVEFQAHLTVKGISEPQNVVARLLSRTPDAVTVAIDTEVERERFGLLWNKFGMMRGLTGVQIEATFRRAH